MIRPVIRLERPSKEELRAARAANPGAVIEVVGQPLRQPKGRKPPPPEAPWGPQMSPSGKAWAVCARCDTQRRKEAMEPVALGDANHQHTEFRCRDLEWCGYAAKERAERQPEVISEGEEGDEP